LLAADDVWKLLVKPKTAKDGDAKEKHQEKHQVEHDVELNETHFAVLEALETKSLSRKELFATICMSSDTRSFKRNVAPLIEAGYIEMTVPDKPRSKLQKYKLTGNGLAVIKGMR